MYKHTFCVSLLVMEKGSEKYEKCLYYSSNALARVLTRLAEEAFQPTGLAPSYAFLMMSVNDRPDGSTPTELSEVMMLTPSTVTRLVEKMENKGLVEREKEGRNTYVKPTFEGLKLQPKIKECWSDLKSRYTENLGEKESDQFAEAMYDVTKVLKDR